MAMDEKGLGVRLQAARKKVGLTQQQLCQRANLSYSTLAKIERGAIKTPSIFTIQSIAAALSVSLDTLVGTPTPASRKTGRTKSGVSFIYFDVNGCLVRFFQRAFTRLAEATDTPADVVESAFWHYNDEVCRGTMSLSDFNRAMAKRIGIEQLDWQSYYLEAVEPIAEMQQLVCWAAEHYQVGLLTNIMPGFVTALRAHGLIPDIAYDSIVESSEVGAIKPEAAIYQTAAARSGVGADEILLIDDTRMNLIAAEHLGWHVLWFDSFDSARGVASIRTALEPA